MTLWLLFVLLSFNIVMIILSTLVGLLIAAPLYYFARYFWDQGGRRLAARSPLRSGVFFRSNPAARTRFADFHSYPRSVRSRRSTVIVYVSATGQLTATATVRQLQRADASGSEGTVTR